MSAKNHNAGKPKWSLLLTDFADELREVLRVREVIEASGKYDRMNFAQSQGKPEAKVFLEDNIDSIERHLLDRRANKQADPETQCFHMAHICVRALIDLSYALHDKQALSTEECEDILQEDVSLQCIETRFDWSNAPCDAKYAAIDRNGTGWWYPIRPKFAGNWFFGAGNGDPIGKSMLREGEDWRTTLEERPYEECEDILQEDARALEYALARQELSNGDCEDILQEDVSLQCIESRYPWHEAPEWATCAAVDSDSYGIWYAKRPAPNDMLWITDGRLAMIGFRMLRDGEDWRTTLEMKP